jgi:hypothetical protein
MSYRTVIYIAAAAILGIACVPTEALAYRGGVRAGGVRGIVNVIWISFLGHWISELV